MADLPLCPPSPNCLKCWGNNPTCGWCNSNYNCYEGRHSDCNGEVHAGIDLCPCVCHPHSAELYQPDPTEEQIAQIKRELAELLDG